TGLAEAVSNGIRKTEPLRATPGLSCRDRRAHRLALRIHAPREEIAMRKVIFVRKSKLLWTVATVFLVAAAGAYVGWRLSDGSAKPASAGAPRVIHLVTGEFVATLDNGKKIEVYRWDPGTVIVPRGEPVELRITGVSGGSHPFIIEGLGITGEVR